MGWKWMREEDLQGPGTGEVEASADLGRSLCSSKVGERGGSGARFRAH